MFSANRQPARRLGLMAGLAPLPLAFLAVFFIFPVVSVLYRGLVANGAEGFGGVVGSSRLWSVAWFTLWQAVVSTVVTLAVGLPGAAVLSRLSPGGQRWARALVTVPFTLPTVLVAGAFFEVLRVTGLDGPPWSLRHSVWVVIAAHAFFNYAVVVRTVGSFWTGLDDREEEAARVLGAGRWATWWQVTLPRLRPAIAAASAIVFLFSFTSFGVVLVLGGPRRSTLETEIYRYAVTRGDLSVAAGLASVQLLAVLAMVIVANRLERRRPIPSRLRGRTPGFRTRRWPLANALVAGVLLGGPILVLIERSLVDGSGYGLGNYQALTASVRLLPVSAVTALANSFVVAGLAAGLAGLVGLCAALVVVHGRTGLSRLFDLGLTLPLGTSAVTMGFGILIALDRPPVDWRTSWWIVPVAHALVGVPFVIRSLVPVLRAIDPSTREAAAVLGASPSRVWREIDLPVGARGLVVGVGFAFAVSMGEFGATAFLPRQPDQMTAPVVLFRLLTSPGEALRGQAMALSVVLMLAVALAVVVIEAGSAGRRGAF